MTTSMTDGQHRAGVISVPIELVAHIPGSTPVTTRVGHIDLPLPEAGAEIDEKELGKLIGDFLASAAKCYQEEGAGGDTTVR